MRDSLRRRFFIALLLSFAIHGVLLSRLHSVAIDVPGATESISKVHSVKLTAFKPPPLPTPAPTPTPAWKRLDPSMLKKIRMTPADEQIVVMAARQANGAPSRAPHIMRVEITPGVVRPHSVMHIKVLTAAGQELGAEGVYIRFIVWEVGVPPIGGYRLPLTDPDYPGRRYELFERDYRIPAIPWLYRHRTYQVEVIATGRFGIASGALVPIKVL